MKMAGSSIYAKLLICQFAMMAISIAHRHLTVDLNPDCQILGGDCSHLGLDNATHSANNLIHYRSTANQSDEESLHFLFSTIGAPSLLFVRSTNSTQLLVDWNSFVLGKPGSLSFRNGKITQEYGIAVTKLIVFNDVHDNADVDAADPSNARVYAANTILWKNASISNNSARICTSSDGENKRIFASNGSFCLEFHLHSSFGRSKTMPRLRFTDKSGQVDLELDQMNSHGWKRARVALELVVVMNGDPKIADSRSIDDEYTPGIFKTSKILIPKGAGYLVWKPVCYKNSDRSRSSLTQIRHDSLRNTETRHHGLLTSYFSNSTFTWKNFNLTLGFPKDKFYASTNFTVCSLGFGFGKVPKDRFSGLMVTVIICCFALPLLALLAGFGFWILSKWTKRPNDGLLLQDEEYPVSLST